MTSRWKHNIISLIQAVEAHPCLWDKSSNIFKDKNERKKAWRKVYCMVESNFDSLSPKEQEKVGADISGKWVNIRDAFVRSLKKKSGKSETKTYLYSNYLQFLRRVLKINSSNLEDSGPETDDPEPESSRETTPVHILQQRHKRRRTVEPAVIQELVAPPTFVDDDMAFFQSILPIIHHWSEDDKLDFRMGVLSLIQSIKKKQSGMVPATSTSQSNFKMDDSLEEYGEEW